MLVKGEVVHVGYVEQISDKFSKCDLVLRTDYSTQYPQEVLFQVVNKNCDQVDNLKHGDIVEVDFNLRGRKWEKDGEVRWFNTLDAYKITPSF